MSALLWPADFLLLAVVVYSSSRQFPVRSHNWEMSSSVSQICQRVWRLGLLSRHLSESVGRRQTRSLLTPTSEIPYKTSTEVIRALTKNVIGRTWLTQLYPWLVLQVDPQPMILTSTTSRERSSSRSSPLTSPSYPRGGWLIALTLRSFPSRLIRHWE